MMSAKDLISLRGFHPAFFSPIEPEGRAGFGREMPGDDFLDMLTKRSSRRLCHKQLASLSGLTLSLKSGGSTPGSARRWMATRMFNDRDSQLTFKFAEIDNVWKPLHQCSAKKWRNFHPSSRIFSNTRHQLVKLFNKLRPKPGLPAIVVVSNRFEFLKNCWMIFDRHWRSCRISSGCPSAFTSPDSTSRSRSSASFNVVSSSMARGSSLNLEGSPTEILLA